MIALRQIQSVPKNHQVVIEIPAEIEENQIVEVILLFKEKSENKKTDKLSQLKACQHDPLFLADLQTVSDDFNYIDSEDW